MSALSSTAAAFARRNVRDFALSASLTVTVTLQRITGPSAYSPSTGAVVAPTSEASLSAFRGVVTEDKGDVRMGDVFWCFNPADTTTPRQDDMIRDSAGVIWKIYKVETDPLTALIRCYTRRTA